MPIGLGGRVTLSKSVFYIIPTIQGSDNREKCTLCVLHYCMCSKKSDQEEPILKKRKRITDKSEEETRIET